MAHNCGANTITYTPSGDGFGATMIAARTAAAREYLTAFIRCLNRIHAWSRRPCPSGCPLPAFAGIDIGAERIAGKKRPDGRWQVHVNRRLRATVICLALPKGVKAAAKAPGKAGKKKRRLAGAQSRR